MAADKNVERQDKVTKPKKEFFLVRMARSISRGLRDMVAELRKVTWPTRKDLVTYTVVVVVFIVAMSAVTGLLDAGASAVFRFVVGLGS